MSNPGLGLRKSNFFYAEVWYQPTYFFRPSKTFSRNYHRTIPMWIPFIFNSSSDSLQRSEASARTVQLHLHHDHERNIVEAAAPRRRHTGQRARPPTMDVISTTFSSNTQAPGAGACKLAAAAVPAIVLPSSFLLTEPCPPCLLLLLQLIQPMPSLKFANMNWRAYAKRWMDSGIFFSNTGDGILYYWITTK